MIKVIVVIHYLLQYAMNSVLPAIASRHPMKDCGPEDMTPGAC